MEAHLHHEIQQQIKGNCDFLISQFRISFSQFRKKNIRIERCKLSEKKSLKFEIW